eukprot:m.87444 g.87444  ORF g.87444 m.87444 type:complete len:684 (-) comp14909_c0_seq2:142-2193(-)
MGRKSSGFVTTVPPQLAGIQDELGACDEAQREALVEAVTAGQVSVEDATRQAQQIVKSTFEAKHLGSVPVASANLSSTMWSIFGAEVISTAGPRIKLLKRKPVPVRVSITSVGFRVVEDKTGIVVEEEPISVVVYAAVDASDSKKVGVITQHTKLGLLYCHVFLSKNSSLAASISDSAMQAVQTNRATSGDEVEADRHEKATGATVAIFEVRLLGVVPVDHIKSRRACVKEAVSQLQARLAASKGKEVAVPTVVVITSEAFRAVEVGSREVVSSAFIENIVYYSGVDGKKQGLFCVVFKDARINRKTCAVFCCQQGEGQVICSKMKEAAAQHKKDNEARSNNPFMPFSSHGDAVTEPLASKQIPRKSLKYVKPLGTGQFGEVALAEQATDDGTVMRAVKTLRGGATQADKTSFLREFELMVGLEHPNLVNLVGVCATQRPWLAVLELVQYGDLLDVIKACDEHKVELSLDEKLTFSIGIARGLEYVASQRLVHMDVAARNCLVDAGNVVKVADFGLARVFDEGKDYFVMRDKIPLSIRWLCVEVMGPPPKCISEKSDVWSFGVTVWEIFSRGKRPYRKLKLKDVQKFVYRGGRLAQPSGCPEEIFQLMLQCWAKDPLQRPSFTEIVQLLMTSMSAAPNVRDIGAVLEGQAVQTEDAEDESDEALQIEGAEALVKGYAYPQDHY